MRTTLDRDRALAGSLRRLALGVAAACALGGCPGSIDDPARFRTDIGVRCPSDFDVERDLFQQTCGQLACHTGGPALAAAGLDLSAPGVGARLLAHVSTECGGRRLIDPWALESSYLIEKLGESPECGDQMPAGMGSLNPIERVCLDAYLAELVATVAPDGSVPPDGAVTPIDGGPRADAGPPIDGGLSAVTLEAEAMTLVGYVVDAANPSVVRLPDAVPTGTATETFRGGAGRYTMTVHVVAEIDGQPTLRVSIAGAEVMSATYPLSTLDFQPLALPSVDVDLADGDVIELAGASNGSAWARIDRVELVP